MNNLNLRLILLKGLGLGLLLVSLIALPKVLGTIIALLYYGISSSREFVGIDYFAAQALSVNLVQVILLGWLAIQVLREKRWVLLITKIEKPEQDRYTTRD